MKLLDTHILIKDVLPLYSQARRAHHPIWALHLKVGLNNPCELPPTKKIL